MRALEVGQIWKTKKKDYVPSILILRLSPETVFFNNAFNDKEQYDTQLSLDAFLLLLANGEYERPPQSIVTQSTLNSVKPSPTIKLSSKEDTGKKYLRTIRSKNQRGPDGKFLTVEVDIYCVIDSYGPFSAAMSHAIKKVLCPGGRGTKDKITDLKEAIVSIQHEIESETENLPVEETELNQKPDNPSTLPKPEDLPTLGDIRFHFSRGVSSNPIMVKAALHKFIPVEYVEGRGLRKTKEMDFVCDYCKQPYSTFLQNIQFCPKAKQ